MLDTPTKARIDSARDILVGKVPDPKSQVEQITIALIYKFMDDMDRQSEELGGRATFFTGQFRKYRWSQLLDKRLGGHERLLLYAEGIEKMNENKNIPQLFRDIFKGVFLPYRDPETLNLFLKEINGFTYEHSERLGDAYEYLLSVLGTQGSAGQFRTPRHIIDFIVAIVDPQKHETVLDPACGTAGFLISAYKHIMNCGLRIADCGLKKGQINNQHSKIKNELTPDERARLMTNFRGYDIAPDMVRLSRVNMYLHGFPNPVIHEYDALTSEERWDERCDVIMANPPFMTPKGGIRPHNRFSIKANRSEVLFVDYIAEHLNPGGRAGVIVPEGIIFQGQNAYKALRRMLVENYLWAVVSLPAGVFNPYSGVKTSILFLDRNLAKRSEEVLFVKIENDGFDLGAQRRLIEKNDLPEATEIIRQWKTGHREAMEKQKGKMAHAVSRTRVLESSDCTLSGDRYREILKASSKWPMVKLGDIASEIKSGFACGTSDGNVSGIPHLRPMNISTEGQLVWEGTKYVSQGVFADKAEYLLKAGDVLFNNTNSKELVGKTCFIDRDIIAGFSNHITRIRADHSRVNPRLVAVLLHGLWRRGEFLNLCNRWVGQAGINNTVLSNVAIPIPPLEMQEKTVAELDGYRKIIEGARQVVASYKPSIRIDPEWPTKKLGAICRNLDGRRVPIEKGKRKPGKYPYYGASGIVDYVDGYIFDGNYLLLSEDGANLLARSTPITFSVSGKVWVNNHAHVLEFDDAATQQFVEQYINGIDISEFVTGAAQPKLSQANMNRIPMPIPPLEVQHQVVAESEAERNLVESNRKLIDVFEKKIQARLAEIWGETGH